GVTERAGHQVLYVKDGDGIVRTLSLMGASRAVIEFENVRVVREVSGQVNRRLNFETANIDKTIGSAMRQVAAIEQLERSGRLAEPFSRPCPTGPEGAGGARPGFVCQADSEAAACQFGSGSTGSGASAGTSSGLRTSSTATSRWSPSTTWATRARSRTCSS